MQLQDFLTQTPLYPSKLCCRNITDGNVPIKWSKFSIGLNPLNEAIWSFGFAKTSLCIQCCNNKVMKKCPSQYHTTLPLVLKKTCCFCFIFAKSSFLFWGHNCLYSAECLVELIKQTSVQISSCCFSYDWLYKTYSYISYLIYL